MKRSRKHRVTTLYADGIRHRKWTNPATHSNEGIEWIRGWHDKDSEDVRAMRASRRLSPSTVSTRTRFFAIDGTNGDDANTGRQHLSPAAAGAHPLKTWAALNTAMAPSPVGATIVVLLRGGVVTQQNGDVGLIAVPHGVQLTVYDRRDK